MNDFYRQPNFYRFSEDSIFLSKIVVKHLEKNKKDNITLIDLCAGCGVVGIEVLQNIKAKIRYAAFWEKQKDFLPFLKKNIDYVNIDHEIVEIDIINTDANKRYLNLLNNKKYSLIVSNPPYFKLGHGRPSPDIKKRICRFYDENFYFNFFQLVREIMSQNGELFFVGRFEVKEFDFIKDLSLKIELYSRKDILKIFKVTHC